MTLSEVFEDNIKDLYHAEKQLTKALPKLIKKATDTNLRTALENHLTETEEHVRRLEQAAEMMGIKPSGKVCHGMMGIVEEANEHTGELSNGPVMDAVIIECAQKAEHYEICAYGTLCSWGGLLGQDKIVKLLQQNMADEENADNRLTEIAESIVNLKACEVEKKGKATDGKMSKAVVSTGAKTSSKEKAGSVRR
jgi:ferritin-like metal-binding protein YciE